VRSPSKRFNPRKTRGRIFPERFSLCFANFLARQQKGAKSANLTPRQRARTNLCGTLAYAASASSTLSLAVIVFRVDNGAARIPDTLYTFSHSRRNHFAPNCRVTFLFFVEDEKGRSLVQWREDILARKEERFKRSF
jgi:hypothetical protein